MANHIITVDPVELAQLATKIGTELDNPIVNLDRASYVTGTVSFGSLCLDVLTGGGLPPGKMVDIFGPEGSGKSTLMYHVISNAQKLSIPCFVYDAECGADSMYLRALRVRIRMNDGSKNPLFNYFQPTTGESVYRHINRMLDHMPDYTSNDSGRPYPTAIFFIDSVAAMLPETLDEDDENKQRGVSASTHTIGLRQIKGKLGRKNCSLLFTNQTRLSPGAAYGNPEYEPGGQAIKYYPDLKLRISGIGKPFLERGRQMRFCKIRSPKNKQFVPFIESLDETIAIAHGHGFDRGYDGWGFLKMTGQISNKGSWYTLNVPDERWADKKLQRADLVKLCCTNEFRAMCQLSINDGSAFTKFFDTMKWEKMYEFDEEDPGDLTTLTGEVLDSGTGEITEVELV